MGGAGNSYAESIVPIDERQGANVRMYVKQDACVCIKRNWWFENRISFTNPWRREDDDGFANDSVDGNDGKNHRGGDGGKGKGKGVTELVENSAPEIRSSRRQ